MLGIERRKRSEKNTVKVEAISVTETELLLFFFFVGVCVSERYSLNF